MTETAVAVDPERLARVTKLHVGKRDPGSDQMCVMEAVAFVTHKKWTDHPPCVCPVIGAFMRTWNDGLPDNERGMLLPFIPRLINTRNALFHSFSRRSTRSKRAQQGLISETDGPAAKSLS